MLKNLTSTTAPVITHLHHKHFGMVHLKVKISIFMLQKKTKTFLRHPNWFSAIKALAHSCPNQHDWVRTLHTFLSPPQWNHRKVPPNGQFHPKRKSTAGVILPRPSLLEIWNRIFIAPGEKISSCNVAAAMWKNVWRVFSQKKSCNFFGGERTLSVLYTFFCPIILLINVLLTAWSSRFLQWGSSS